MILYIEDQENWRIPKEIVKNVNGAWQYASSIRTKNAAGTDWDIKWHSNLSPTTNTIHPFWLYSMNPYFSVEETNIGGITKKICYHTGLSNPNNHGTYAAGSNICHLYINEKDSNNFADCILESVFPLSVTPGHQYRISVTVVERNNFGSTLNLDFGVWSAPTYEGAAFKGVDYVTLGKGETSPTSGTQTYDFTVPSNPDHFWARPWLKIIGTNIGSTLPNYVFSEWLVSRTG